MTTTNRRKEIDCCRFRPPVDLRPGVLVILLGGVLVFGSGCRKEDSKSGIKPAGYYVSKSLPSAGLRGGDLAIRKGSAFLVVEMAVPANRFVISEPEYLAMVDEHKKMGDPIHPREHCLHFDTSRFMLILGDGRGYFANAIQASGGPDGFMSDSTLLSTKQPPEAMQIIEVAWIRLPNEAEPPFSVRFGDEEPVPVPDVRLRE